LFLLALSLIWFPCLAAFIGLRNFAGGFSQDLEAKIKKIFDFIGTAVFAAKALCQGSPDPAGLMGPGGISGNSFQAVQEQMSFFLEGFIEHIDFNRGK